jgi:hypothetical protein
MHSSGFVALQIFLLETSLPLGPANDDAIERTLSSGEGKG